MDARHSTKHINMPSSDIERNLIKSTEGPRLMRSIILSYRRYGHLTQTEKNIFNRSKPKLRPRVWAIALYLKKVYGTSFKAKYFKEAEKYTDLYDEAYIKYMTHINTIPDQYLIKQLKWEGWVTLEEYGKLRDKFSYTMTNRKLDSHIWVYPMKFADNYQTLQKGKYPFYQKYFGDIGIPGITKISYSNEH